jgi:EmrB/QacA subfamily drug resistance transporter
LNDISPERERAWVLALVALASFTVALDAMVMATALTKIQANLEATLHQLEWSVNGYNLSFAVLLSIGAALGEQFGRRRFFIAGLMIFMLASIACAISQSIEMLIAARVIQGAGAAFIMPLGMAMLGAAYPREIRGKALGKFGAITGLAVLSGPVVGGAITEGVNWTWIFWINVPIGLVLVSLAMLKLNESHGGNARADIPGVLLMAGTALGVTWALMRAGQLGWGGSEVHWSFAVALVLLVAFIVRQRTAVEPMLPPSLFTYRGFTGGLAATFFHYGALYGTLFFIAQFFQVGQGYTPLEAGLRVLPWTATLFFAAPVVGNLIHTLGERPLITLGLLFEGTGLAIIAFTARQESGLIELALPLILAGIGASMAIPAMQSSVMSSVAPEQMGKATGAYGVSQFLGGVTGVAFGTTAFALRGSYESQASFVAGFTGAAWSVAAMAFAGSLCAGLLVPTRQARGALAPTA